MKVACIFPGQGSQKVGMGKDFYEAFPEAREIFHEADEILGFSLSDMCFNGPAEALKLTANTQPALLTVSAAIASVLRKHTNLKADVTAGHSLGEYTALWFAESLAFADAVKLVRVRGEAMQAATPEGVGGMAAILGLEEDEIIKICEAEAKGQVLEAANFNGPGQVVVSGHVEAVRRAADAAKKAGAKRSVMLPVSAPFHCALMAPAAERMQKELEQVEIHPPKIPVVNNVDADILPPDAAAVRASLARQVTSPVRWEQSVRRMVDLGVEIFIEIGAGRVLSNLVKRISPASKFMAVGDLKGLERLQHLFE